MFDLFKALGQLFKALTHIAKAIHAILIPFILIGKALRQITPILKTLFGLMILFSKCLRGITQVCSIGADPKPTDNPGKRKISDEHVCVDDKWLKTD